MKIKLTNPNEGVQAFVKEITRSETLTELELSLSFSRSQSPETLSLEFSFPCDNIYSFWSPSLASHRNLRPDWGMACTKGRLASWMPIMQALSLGGDNRMTVTLSDVVNPHAISMGINEESATVCCKVDFFIKLVAPMTEYKATLRLDTAGVKYWDAIQSGVRWMEQMGGFKQAPVPEYARLPMYSAWYSFHQNINVPAIVEQCRLAKTYGMETLILDDGWQTDDNNRGYAYCGDWKVAEKKLGSMRRFSDLVHAEGMKFMIWFSVPFVGVHSEAYDRFRDMLLDGNEPANALGFYCLDPRYPQVRDYLIGIYENALREWNLDGLKLDFIDAFSLKKSTPVTDPRRDTVSLEDGVNKLLSETVARLQAIRPDVLIEFRQSYIGPAIRQYGNMLRAADCPNDAMKNREQITDLRFTSGSTAVHSDMLMWNVGEPVESAAVQVISTLFSVPQISVLLDQIPQQHQKMLRFYLSFWRENRHVLLDGSFFALNPEAEYSLAGAWKDGEGIAVDYVGKPWEIREAFTKLTFINCHAGDHLICRFSEDLGQCRIKVLNCMGELLQEEVCTVSKGIFDRAVPPSGLLVLEQL